MGLIQNILTIGKRIGVGRLFILLTLVLSFVACYAKKQPAEESFDVTVYLPQTISVEQGGTYSFQILGKGNAKMGDVVNATSLSGKTPNMRLNNTDFKELLFYGLRAAA